jgi:hypothetical protein
MKARLLLLLLLPLCMWASASHAQDKMTPIQFNDELVKVTETLYQMGTEWGTKFAAVAADKDFGQLSPLRQKLTDYIKTQSKTTQQLPAVGKGAEDFRKAMLDFLVFENEMITSGFIPIEQLGKNATEADIQGATEKLTSLAAKEGEALDKVHKAQDKYATDNNFVVEDAK